MNKLLVTVLGGVTALSSALLYTPIQAQTDADSATAARPRPPAREIDVAVKITVTNIGPEAGSAVTPLWFGFHDGTFRTYTEGRPASTGLEHLAEDAVEGTGLFIEEFVNDAVDKGLPLADVHPLPELLAGVFASRIGRPLQGVVYPQPISPIGLAFFPGETNSTTRVLHGDFRQFRYLSYAAMIFPSNDAFIADRQPLELFNSAGDFVAKDFIVRGEEVLDAGTEVNDELPTSVPFSLSVYGKGTSERGVVKKHPGLKPLGAGGVLDVAPDVFKNANFRAPNYQLLHVTIEKL